MTKKAQHTTTITVDATSSNINDTAPQRPTEAQLRWAKFQHRSKARVVKEQVNKLYQTPLSANDVPNARADDDASTVISGGSSTISSSPRIYYRKRRPQVSRGRRALLRVSQRSYAERLAAVQRHGYNCKGDDDGARRRNNSGSPQRRRKKSNLIRRRNTFKNRFQEAQAMLKSLGSSQPEVIRATKRWKRPQSLRGVNADVVTNYDEWQWGLARRRRTALRRMTTSSISIPLDRRASWLTHVPAKSERSIPVRYMFSNQRSAGADGLTPVSLYDGEYHGDILSPCQIKFEEMVSRMQGYDSMRCSTGGLGRGVVSARYLDQLPRSEPIQSPRVVRRPRNHMDPFNNGEEEAEPIKVVRRSYRRSQGSNFESSKDGDDDDEEEYYEEYYEDENGDELKYQYEDEYGEVYDEEYYDEDDNFETDETFSKKGKYEYYRQKQEEEALRIIRKSRHSNGQNQSSAQTGQSRVSDGSSVEFNATNNGNNNEQEQPVSSPLSSQLGSIPEQSSNRMQQRNNPKALTLCKETLAMIPTEENSLSTPLSRHRERGSLFDKGTPLTEESDVREIASSSSSFRAGAVKVAGGLFQMVTGRKPTFSPSNSNTRSETHKSSRENQRNTNNTNENSTRSETHKSSRENQRNTNNTNNNSTSLSEGFRRMVLRESEKDASKITFNDNRVDDINYSDPEFQASNGVLNQNIDNNGRACYPALDTPGSFGMLNQKDHYEKDYSAMDPEPDFIEDSENESGCSYSNPQTSLGMEADYKHGQNHSDLASNPSFDMPNVHEDRVRHSDCDVQNNVHLAKSRNNGKDFSHFEQERSFHIHGKDDDDDELDDSYFSPKSNFDTHKHGKNKFGRSDLDTQQTFDTLNPSYSEEESPGQSFASRSAVSSLSPEHGPLIHRALITNDLERPFIDTDGTTSDASGYKMDFDVAASLLMSPTVLTKRHQQAIKSIERRNWQQLNYLVNANPWLAEMTDVTTQQYLLHKLALFGASKFLWTDDNDTVDVVPAASQKLNDDLIRLFPSAVHKFDQDGNLPLHMAAASGNIEMTILLGEKFSSGASVRNNDGMLPLHLAIQACSNPLADTHGEFVSAVDFVSLILNLFPGGLAVADSEGDLPLHMAAAALEGEVGVDMVYFLLDEAERQSQSENGLRFVERTKIKTDEGSIDDDDETVDTEAPTDSSSMDDDAVHCNMIRNENGLTALTKAIKSGSGWEIIEAITRGPGGSKAALWPDANKCNALHLLLSEEYGDPQAALSILRVAPKATTARNSDGMLPIETAFRNEMPDEVILALALIDSPVDLTNKESVRRKAGFGGSWRFLMCQSDDRYSNLVEEIVSVCSNDHLHALCYMDESIIANATPLCRGVLQRALESGQEEI